MESQFQKQQVLIKLGLTQVQARVYLALVKSGPSKILAISKTSNVARPEIYRNLSKLQALGLVERIIKRPLEYRAIPMDQGLSLLLAKRTSYYKKVRAEARLLIKTIKKEKPRIENKKIETPQFVLIPKGNATIRINAAMEKAQLGIDVVTSWKRFSNGIVNTFAESMENVWARKVRTRFIIEKPLKSKTAKELIQFFKEKAHCQMRFIPSCPKTNFEIYDKKEVLVILSETGLSASPAFWSNNPSLVGLALDHFEILWLAAVDKPQL